MKTKPLMLLMASAAVLWCGPAASSSLAQPIAPPNAAVYQPLSDQQLDQLLGPIALYPDPLLAEILPAATLPTEIVLANRYLQGGGDPNQVLLQPWDTSVKALAHYPAVLKYLDDNLPWTIAVGQAFLNQQQEVMESIQRLRLSAENFGNLVSTPQQEVVNEDGDVEILPAEPDVVYVPIYQPQMVYFQAGYGLSFGLACSLGSWLDCDFDWVHHNLHYWGGRRPARWWHATGAQRAAWLANRSSVWHPEDHGGVALNHRGDRGWNRGPGGVASVPEHNAVVPMSHSGSSPRPAAAPRAAATPSPSASPRAATVREAGTFHQSSGPAAAPAPRQAPEGMFGGNESSHDTRSFSDRGHQSEGAATHSEPAHTEAPHSEPSHPQPAPAPAPSHAAASGDNGGGGHGGSRR